MPVIGATRSTSVASSSAVAIGPVRRASTIARAITPGEGFLAKTAEEGRELGRVEGGQQFGRRNAAPRIEAHVERASGPETEPAIRVRELVARQAEVEEAAVHGTEALGRRDFSELAEVRLAQAQPISEARPEPVPDSGDGRPIGVEAEQAAIRVGGPQDSLRVTAAPDRRIDLEAAGGGREHAHDLLDEHRHMAVPRIATADSRRVRSDPWMHIWFH